MSDMLKVIAEEKAKLNQEFEELKAQLAEIEQVSARLRVEMEHKRGAHMRLDDMERRLLESEETKEDK